MKNIIFVLIIFIAAPVFADQASHRRKTEELIDLMDFKKEFDKSTEILKLTALNLAKDHEDSPPQGELEVAMEEVFSPLKGLNWEKVREGYIGIYMDLYSEEEIGLLLEFYKSPVGRKGIELRDEMRKRSVELMMGEMYNHVPVQQSPDRDEMMEELDAYTDSLKKEIQNSPGL